MLAEIRQDLVLQEYEADTLHNQQTQECDTEITEFSRRINAAEVARDDAQNEIVLLHGEISNLQGDITNKGKQLEIIDNREIQLKADREQDAFDFEARQSQGAQVLDAIDIILDKLGGITPGASSEAVFAQLAKIGGSNPILALAQVASTFSADSLNKVTKQMTDLKESISNTLEEDRNSEDAAVQDYNAFLGEIANTRRNIANSKSELETTLAQTEAALALQENILEESVEELAAAQSGKAAKEQICADWTATWERNKEGRQTELGLIAQVSNILAT
jgi:chromosome segregation ATPase